MNTVAAASQSAPASRAALVRHWPLALLVVVLLLVLALLWVRGLTLGFTGDLLDYAFHYDRLGTFGGMRWLITEHLHRHLLAGLFSAPIAYLFPQQSAPWYAYAFLAHFANGVMTYLLADTILRGHYRWVSFSAALLFVFHTLHAELNFEFPTSGHGNSALVLALLSLWLYLQYVRRGRRNRWWREWSLLTYAIALMIYEQTVLFFLLHPLVAYVEDTNNRAFPGWRPWILRLIGDSFWYPVIVVGYLYLLRVLFPPGDNLVFSPPYIVSQLGQSLAAEFNPVALVARVLPAFQNGSLLLTLGVALLTALLLFVWASREPVAKPAPQDLLVPRLAYLVAFGLCLSLVSMLGIAPTAWAVADHPRMIYPSAVGFGLFFAGSLAWLLRFLPAVRLRGALFAVLAALLVAAGITQLFAIQSDYLAANQARQRVLDAVQEAVPSFAGDVPPYLLLYTGDAHPTTDLALFAQDIRFPLMFEWMYGTDGLLADALYFDVNPARAPAPDLPGEGYNGPFIVVESEGIYSPLLPYIPVDPARLVIVQYDNAAGSAQVLEALPPGVVSRANIVERVPFEWRTNPALLGSEGR